MKTFFVLMFSFLLANPVLAADELSLNEAVNQAKSEGQVLSAKTVDGHHEIKVLTKSGTVKTINRPVAANEGKRPEYYLRGGQSMRDRNQNQAIPERFRTTRADKNTRQSKAQRQRNTSRSQQRGNERSNNRQNRNTSGNKKSNSNKDK